MTEETWKDLLAYDEPKGFRPPHWCAVLVEVTVFLLFGIGAALLRFTDWAPLYKRQDIDLLCLDIRYNQPMLPDEYTLIYYVICVAAPFGMILICEIERSYYSVNPNYKVFSGAQRFFYISLRPIGMFILGIFIVSIITDYIKALVALPRPYFFVNYKQFCLNSTIMNGNLTVEERYGLTSFPCHLSTISSFSAFLATTYILSSISLNSAPIIKPAIGASLFILTVGASIYRVEINYNHWVDIIGGFGIGSLFGYIIYLVLKQRHRSHSEVITEAACKLLIPRVALPRNGNHRDIHSGDDHRNPPRANQSITRSMSNPRY